MMSVRNMRTCMGLVVLQQSHISAPHNYCTVPTVSLWCVVTDRPSAAWYTVKAQVADRPTGRPHKRHEAPFLAVAPMYTIAERLRTKLRFKVGDRVECNYKGSFSPGVIVKCWYEAPKLNLEWRHHIRLASQGYWRAHFLQCRH